jgi:DNA-binding PadR family transcriptional regulator
MTMRPNTRTPFAILGVLAMHPMSGAEIRRWLDERIGNFWRESSGQLYPTLTELTTQKLVRSSPRAQSGTRGRPATEYTITAAGRVALSRWLEAPVASEPRRIELLLKLFLSADDPHPSLAHLARCRAEQLEFLAHYARIDRELEHLAVERPAESAKFRVTLRYGVRVAEALLAWTDEAAGVLTAGAAAELAAPRAERR